MLDPFLQICVSKFIPSYLWLPASDELLYAFAASKVGLVGAGTPGLLGSNQGLAHYQQ